MTAEAIDGPRVLAVGAYERDNVGDLLFLLVTERYLRGAQVVAAAPGYEFADLGGRHHAGGGSHGSLDAGDSEVPMLAVGLEPPSSITEVAPAVLRHFGVPPPTSMREAVRAA